MIKLKQRSAYKIFFVEIFSLAIESVHVLIPFGGISDANRIRQMPFTNFPIIKPFTLPRAHTHS